MSLRVMLRRELRWRTLGRQPESCELCGTGPTKRIDRLGQTDGRWQNCTCTRCVWRCRCSCVLVRDIGTGSVSGVGLLSVARSLCLKGFHVETEQQIRPQKDAKELCEMCVGCMAS